MKRDFGTRVEVDTGIKAGDQVILNPPVNLVDGSKVQARAEDTAANKLRSRRELCASRQIGPFNVGYGSILLKKSVNNSR